MLVAVEKIVAVSSFKFLVQIGRTEIEHQKETGYEPNLKSILWLKLKFGKSINSRKIIHQKFFF